MRIIPLTQGYKAIVDDENYERIKKYNWHAIISHKLIYAVRTIYPEKKRIWLHNFIMSPPEGFTVDHIDRDGLNCQRSNMRFATKSQQSMNRLKPGTLEYRGIRPVKNLWVARVRVNGKAHEKFCKTKIDAAKAYDELAKKLHGEFATLNFSEK